jgi:hypothetical protein
MNATMVDLLTGAISPATGNRITNEAGKLLKMVERATPSERSRKTARKARTI